MMFRKSNWVIEIFIQTQSKMFWQQYKFQNVASFIINKNIEMDPELNDYFEMTE